MSDAFDSRYTEYQVRRSALRKLVRRAYLASARSKLRGPTLDFGCGIGELLAQLPAGSMGLEYNPATVEHCRERGLEVNWYDGYADAWNLSAVQDARRFESMVISHVLEHFEEPMPILHKLLVAAGRLGIRKVLVIVPGQAGFRIDDTHLAFVDMPMLLSDAVCAGTRFKVVRSGYFPGNLRVIGDWFPHHELQVLYEAR